MTRLYSNNFSTTLSTSIDDDDTSIVLASATGFPTLAGGDTAKITVDDGTNSEIMIVTAAAGTTLTVTRAAEGTTARSFASGSEVEIRATAGSFTEKLDYVAPGTSGNVLTSNGTVWESQPASGGGGGGGLVKLATKSASGASVDFTTEITSTYDNYLFVITGLKGSSAALTIQVSNDGGATWFSSGGHNQITNYLLSSASSISTYAAPNDNVFWPTAQQSSNSAAVPMSGRVEVFNVQLADLHLQWKMNQIGTSGYLRMCDGSGIHSVGATPPYNAIRFAYSSGNFSAGSITIYGYEK